MPSRPLRDQTESRNAYNTIEDFHGRHLSDEQMAELNSLIRNGIYTALVAFDRKGRSVAASRFVNFHLKMIPAYWEEPELTADYLKSEAMEAEAARAGITHGRREGARRPSRSRSKGALKS